MTTPDPAGLAPNNPNSPAWQEGVRLGLDAMRGYRKQVARQYSNGTAMQIEMATYMDANEGALSAAFTAALPAITRHLEGEQIRFPVVSLTWLSKGDEVAWSEQPVDRPLTTLVVEGTVPRCGAGDAITYHEAAGLRPGPGVPEKVTEAERLAFVAGAKWWEFMKSEGFTMWPSDQSEAYAAADDRIRATRLATRSRDGSDKEGGE